MRPRYAERERVLELAKTGKRPKDVAVELGISRNRVYDHIEFARNHGMKLPYWNFKGGSVRTPQRIIYIKFETYDALRSYADKRNISIPSLCRRLLETLIDDCLIDAILDDGDEI